MSPEETGRSSPPLKLTPLHDFHVRLGARMVPFSGYDMPVQYPTGILKEHRHTRQSAGLFDVSHMGQFVLRPKSGTLADASLALERLVPADILSLAPDRQRYTFFTNDRGGIGDDFMAANRGDHLMLVVNAGPAASDRAHLQTHLTDDCDLEVLDRALLALQGPKAESCLAKLAPGCKAMRFMDARVLTILDRPCVVTRSGYTGEDGFEMSLPVDIASDAAARLIEDPDVLPVGLGARDSLRLEAGLPLYGADIDENTSPVEAGLAWAIQTSRRTGGERSGGFPGAGTVLQQIEAGPPRIRVGLRTDGRAPVRGGTPLFAEADGGVPIGEVTSGGFGPTVEAPIAMGYVPARFAEPGMRVFAELRGKRLPLFVTALPFVPHRYNRG